MSKPVTRGGHVCYSKYSPHVNFAGREVSVSGSPIQLKMHTRLTVELIRGKLLQVNRVAPVEGIKFVSLIPRMLPVNAKQSPNKI